MAMAIAVAIDAPGPAGLAPAPPLAGALPGAFAAPLEAARPAAPGAIEPPPPILGTVVALADVELPIPGSADGPSLPHAVGSVVTSISEPNTALCCARTKVISTFLSQSAPQ